MDEEESHLRKFGDIDEPSEIFEIGAFVIELPQAVVLGAVALTQRF
jgi:hypothetical protein